LSGDEIIHDLPALSACALELAINRSMAAMQILIIFFIFGWYFKKLF
jgi:hypothetical protein